MSTTTEREGPKSGKEADAELPSVTPAVATAEPMSPERASLPSRGRAVACIFGWGRVRHVAGFRAVLGQKQDCFLRLESGAVVQLSPQGAVHGAARNSRGTELTV